MAVFVRAKRVTVPLDDKAKARLCGGHCHPSPGSASCSGSEHDAPRLSGLVHDFLNRADTTDPTIFGTDATVSDDNTAGDRSPVPAAEILRDLLDPTTGHDRFRVRLLADVSGTAEELSELRSSPPAFRRAVVARLRVVGYNAGFCKARWEACGGLAGGTHEYIDVLDGGSPPRRYVVDVEFAGEFEIARPTAEYERVVAELPRVAVATAEDVRTAVGVVADAAQRSLRSQGLCVPPWRKSRYMLAKWLGPYRRTINPLPTSRIATATATATAAAAVSGGGSEVKCRSVGFHAAPVLVARTR